MTQGYAGSMKGFTANTQVPLEGRGLNTAHVHRRYLSIPRRGSVAVIRCYDCEDTEYAEIVER